LVIKSSIVLIILGYLPNDPWHVAASTVEVKVDHDHRQEGRQGNQYHV